MRNINDTISRLSAMRTRTMSATAHAGGGRLSELSDFGSNPGALRAHRFVPENLPDHAPLVVVLHGCTQTAAGYDLGSGWSQLAEEQGFALLYPEQQRANNANLCFNWFNPEDTRRDGGEALSIRQMVAAMISAHGLDPARVYVTGLSAGGAMTSVMLATYPDVFAGGAIIAGLPYGTAGSVPEAFDRMRGQGGAKGTALAGLVREASEHQGRWPSISVWHGDSDATVTFANSAMIVEQWRVLHGVAAQPSVEETVEGCARKAWRDADGREVIEEYRVPGLGHGVPLRTAEDGCGAAGAYMLEAGISSTQRIAAFWKLAGDGIEREESRRAAKPAKPAKQDAEHGPAAGNAAQAVRPERYDREPETAAPAGIKQVIEDALRAAGLMR